MLWTFWQLLYQHAQYGAKASEMCPAETTLYYEVNATVIDTDMIYNKINYYVINYK